MAGKSVLDVLKRFGLSFRRNWGLKLVSLLFAVILWNYVITEQDPVRSVPYNDIKIVFDQNSITQLNNTGFTVLGSLPDLTVDVVIDLARNQYQNLSRESIQARVSLAGITSAGEKELKITVSTPIGSIKSQSMSSMKVVVEELDKRLVPVDWKPEGDLPEGYWMGDPTITPRVVEITGAVSLVNKVAKARIVVDLTGLTESLSASREFELLDKEGNVLDPAGLKLTQSNCIVDLEVLPTKRIKVDASKSLNGSVAKGYSIKGQPEVLPTEIVIAGPKAILDTIGSIAPEPIDITGAASDVSVSKPLILPKGVRAVGESTVTVLVKVEQNMTDVPLEGLTVHVLNLAPGLKVDGKQLRANVMATCPELLASQLNASMITLTVDATGLDARTHTLTIRAEYDAEETGITAIVINPESILVTITVAE